MRPEEVDPWREPEGAPPAGLGELLGDLAGRRGWQEKLRGGRVHELWEEIAGEQIAAHAEPVRLRAGVLVLRAESPLWATQLRYLAPTLLARAEEVLGAGAVSQVTVVGGGTGRADQRKRRQ